MMFVLRLYFKKITFTNKTNYPSEGPVILAAMHPNSFIDDMVLGAFTKRELTFLARGDVFSNKINRFLLAQMFVSPIYRAMDNAQDVKKNIEALDSYSDKLRRGKVLLIHSEGICINEKRVRKIRKGTARIAFGAAEKSDFNLGIKIVPVALNYSDAPKIRERVMIDFLPPIELKKYESMYKENSAKAILELNKEIHDALVSKAIHVENKEADVVTNVCLDIVVNNNPPKALPIYDRDPSHLEQEQQVSQHINQLFSNSKEKYNQLVELVNTYTSQLSENKLEDLAFVPAKNVVFRSMILAILSPLFALAYIANVLPVFIGRTLTEKIVKTDEFYGSVYVGASWLLGIIYYIFIAILLGVFTKISAWLTVLVIMVAGFWSVLLRDQYIKLAKQLKFKRILNKKAKLNEEMRATRAAILELLA